MSIGEVAPTGDQASPFEVFPDGQWWLVDVSNYRPQHRDVAQFMLWHSQSANDVAEAVIEHLSMPAARKLERSNDPASPMVEISHEEHWGIRTPDTVVVAIDAIEPLDDRRAAVRSQIGSTGVIELLTLRKIDDLPRPH